MEPYKVAVETLLKDVRIAMDMNVNGEPLDLGDVDTLSLNEIIKSKIETAARMVESTAAHHLLRTNCSIDDSLTDGASINWMKIEDSLGDGESIRWMSRVGNGAGCIQLPDDFLRLVSFQMSDWRRAVIVPISEDDPRYAMQSSRYPGIKGNPQKPVVAITQHPSGLMLEFYSCTGGANVYVKKAQYIPIPKIKTERINSVNTEVIEISEKLIPAVVYQTAALVALSINNDDLASKMQQICNSIKETE